MLRIIKNNKGADKVLSIYWFVVIVIITVGVIAMVYNFYGAPYDVREVESGILSNKVADCISYNSSGFKSDSGENFLGDCGITLTTESDWNNEIQYLIDVNFYNVNDTNSSVFELKKGNLNFISECYIKKTSGADYSRLVKCDEKRLYALDNYGNQYLIKIITGVKKAEKNAKL